MLRSMSSLMFYCYTSQCLLSFVLSLAQHKYNLLEGISSKTFSFFIVTAVAKTIQKLKKHQTSKNKKPKIKIKKKLHTELKKSVAFKYKIKMFGV